MTENLGVWAGAVMAALSIPGAENWVQMGGSLLGTGLLVWIIVRKERDCQELRKVNHELSKELVKRCGECSLARAANESLIEAGKEHFNDKD